MLLQLGFWEEEGSYELGKATVICSTGAQIDELAMRYVF